MTEAAAAGDVFAALLAAHHAADYWVQTEDQAQRKGLPGWEGQLACARHVAVMTGVKAAALTALHVSGHRVRPGRAALALAADPAPAPRRAGRAGQPAQARGSPRRPRRQPVPRQRAGLPRSVVPHLHVVCGISHHRRLKVRAA